MTKALRMRMRWTYAAGLPCRRIAIGALAALVGVAAVPAFSSAATPAPSWSITATSQPTNFHAGEAAGGTFPSYYVLVTNAGGAPTSGPITITDTVPNGVTPTRAYAFEPEDEYFPCPVSGQTVTCTTATPAQPGQFIKVYVFVETSAGATGTLIDSASVSGGGAAEASTTTTTTISPSDASFGFLPGATGFAAFASEADGTVASGAGSHPYAVTINAQFPTAVKGPLLNAVDHVQHFHVQLPRGLVVDPEATPVRCTESELESDLNEEPGAGCPPQSQVGVIYLNAIVATATTQATPLYNMVPPPGTPAEFGFDAAGFGIYVHIAGGLEAGSGYALSATANDIPAKLTIIGFQATLWGNPSDPSHRRQLGWCAAHQWQTNCGSIPPEPIPFLTMPSSCSTPLAASGNASSWEEPRDVVSGSAPLNSLVGTAIVLAGCEDLDFTPSISVTPESSAADSPTGLQVDLKIPQTESQNTLAEANLKKAVVTLPAGMTVNPAAANGMEACPLLSGKEPHPGTAGIDLENNEAANCPKASKIGSVEITTPLLADVLKGGVYVAQQGNLPGGGSNPFGSLLAIYVAAEADGAVIKLAGKVQADPTTGRLTATFDENPELPFSDFKLDFFGGERASLATPTTCGSYAAESAFTSWAQPGDEVKPLVAPFAIASGPVGAVCAAPAFAPTFGAGTSSNQAGAYSPFTMTLARNDGEQRLGAVSFTMPKGLLGEIAKVTQCPEVAANVGACPASSQIGHVQVAAGVGNLPDVLPEPGRREDPIYLTSAYRGAPFGIAVVVRAEAGPFNLGTVVVRGTINVNPETAQVSIATDKSGPYAMPTFLQGVPVDVRKISIDIDKPGFMFNPTSCTPMSLAGSVDSAEGATSAVSARFQAASCAALSFEPKLTATVHAKHTRRKGAYMHVTIKSGSGQANIHKVDVELPKALSVRDSTLNQACSEGQYAANPAGCPSGSVVGHAVAHTPLLSSVLEGPAYFVSHGGREFPNLDIVLQGEGITIELTGKTYVSKKGYTFSRFETVPDAPISRFDLFLPAGSHSALAGNGNFCYRTVTSKRRVKIHKHGHVLRRKGKVVYKVVKARHRQRRTLTMPTTITGQNGAVLRQSTKLAVQGCGKAAKAGKGGDKGKRANGRGGKAKGAGAAHRSGSGNQA